MTPVLFLRLLTVLSLLILCILCEEMEMVMATDGKVVLLEINNASVINPIRSCPVRLKRYSFCDSNLLNITSIESGCEGDTTIFITYATPTVNVAEGKIYVVAKEEELNMEVYSGTYNLCAYMPCPLKAGVDFSTVQRGKIPSEASMAGGIVARTKMFDQNGIQIACIDTKFK